jgi:polygalacturonase
MRRNFDIGLLNNPLLNGLLNLVVLSHFFVLSSSTSSSSTCDLIRDCGAIADNQTLADDAITSCAKRCSTLIFPPFSTFAIASIDISNTSGLSMIFNEGSILSATTNKSAYPITPFYPPMGKTLCYRSPIFGRNVTNFFMTGPTSAIIDGQGATWQPDRPTDPMQAPKLFELVDVENATIVGMTFLNSANWHVHFLWCKNVTFLKNTVLGSRAYGGTDGIDPSSCSDVLIDNAYIDVGDDAIAVTAGGYHDVTGLPMPTNNVHVQNSYLRSRNFAIGSATYSNVSNIVVENTRIGDDDGSAAWGIKIKQHYPNGGIVSDCLFRNLTFGKILNNSYQQPGGGYALAIYSNYGVEEGGNLFQSSPPFSLSHIGNITFQDIKGLSARWAAQPLTGVPNGSSLGPLHFINVSFGHVTEPKPWVCTDDVVGTTVKGRLEPPIPKGECGT